MLIAPALRWGERTDKKYDFIHTSLYCIFSFHCQKILEKGEGAVTIVVFKIFDLQNVIFADFLIFDPTL